MIDKSVPFIGVLMVCDRPVGFEATLPPGYTLRGFSPGLEEAWAKLQFAAGHTDTTEKAEQIFAEEFLTRLDLLPIRCLFVFGPDGQAAATASLWEGEHLGRPLPRLHWVCTRPEDRRKGLAKALMASLMCEAAKLGQPVYLTTQTQSWPAVGLYQACGFVPYYGPKPLLWEAKSGDFAAENDRAWQIILEKLENAR